MVKRNLLWFGFFFAVISLLLMALNWTALPVVMDLSVLTLVVGFLAVLLLALGLWGEMKRAQFRLARVALAVIALLASLRVVTLSLEERYLSYEATEVHFRNNEVKLAGTLYLPRSQKPPYPAIVMIHGSGPETRKEYAYFARLCARQGMAGLAYDKRGTGQSTGKLYAADYRDYANDALAAVRFLGQRADVVAGCIGLMGFSEGEWVAPLAAKTGGVAFLIIVAPSGVSPAQQVDQEIARRLQKRGFPAETVKRAVALNDRVFDYQRTGEGAKDLKTALRAAQSEPWFAQAKDIPAELYPISDYAWWRSVMDFDPSPVWEEVKVPVLILKGGQDPNSDAEIARQRIQSALAKAGNQAQFSIFPKGDHLLLEWPLGSHIPPPVFAHGYLDTLQQWIRQQTCVARPFSPPARP